MSIEKIMEGGNTLLMVTVNDLKEFALLLMEEARKEAKEEREKENYLTESQVCDMLNVTHTTLWRWNKKGNLRYYKLGKRILWKQSDINKLMQGGK